jgi:hypothetical protein
MPLSINATQHKCHSAQMPLSIKTFWIKWRYAECRNICIVMLNVIRLSVIMLSAVMLSVIMLNVVAP